MLSDSYDFLNYHIDLIRFYMISQAFHWFQHNIRRFSNHIIIKQWTMLKMKYEGTIIWFSTTMIGTNSVHITKKYSTCTHVSTNRFHDMFSSDILYRNMTQTLLYLQGGGEHSVDTSCLQYSNSTISIHE